jgi:hypothetical protein
MAEEYTCIECENLYDDRDGDTDERMCNKCLNKIYDENHHSSVYHGVDNIQNEEQRDPNIIRSSTVHYPDWNKKNKEYVIPPKERKRMKLKKNEDAVMTLIYNRLELGRGRYGGDIPINGEKRRDNLKEAIEEAADLSIYLTSLLLEEEAHLKRYQKAYNLLMESWDKLPKENQSYISTKLEELGL